MSDASHLPESEATVASLLQHLRQHTAITVTGARLRRPHVSLQGLSFCPDLSSTPPSCRKHWGWVVPERAWHHSALDDASTKISHRIPVLLISSSSEVVVASLPATFSYIAVCSLKRAWSLSMSFLCGHPEHHLKGVAVTGTNGKTSTVWMVSELMRRRTVSHVALGTFGYRLSIDGKPPQRSAAELEVSAHTTQDPHHFYPLLRWAYRCGARWWVMEMSSHSLQQEKLYGLSFEAVAWTSFSQDHLDYHRSMEQYFAAKRLLFAPPYAKRTTGKIISTQVREAAPSTDAFDNVEGDRPEILEQQLQWHYEAVSGALMVRWDDKVIYEGRSPYFGSLMQRNLVMSLALLEHLMQRKVLRASPAVAGAELSEVPGRMNRYPGDPVVIIDYAHSPHALRGALEDVRESYPDHSIFCVFGCGGERDRCKRPLMGSAALHGADRLWITADNPRGEDQQQINDDILRGMSAADRQKVTLQPQRQQALHQALEQAQGQQVVVLIAGKGAEQGQWVKGRRHPYSDLDVLQRWRHARASSPHAGR